MYDLIYKKNLWLWFELIGSNIFHFKFNKSFFILKKERF